MRLASIHIINYGKLSNYDLKFDNINCICEENGYGKSTIVSFIKAMFYGLETLKNNTSKFVDRKHFYPFNRGVFGGNIIFIYNNKEYRIERIFDEKSEIKDLLKVYCNGNETTELGLIPGITIFGINKENFEKIISINSNKITLQTDSDINKKLNNYIENVSEEFDIDEVLKNLKKYKKEQSDKLKITKDNNKILINEIHNLESIKTSLDNKYLQLNRLENTKKEINSKYEIAQEKRLTEQKYQTLHTYKDEVLKCQNELRELKNKYHEIPKEQEINVIKSLYTDLETTNKLLENNNFDNNEYIFLKNKYENKIDDKNKIEEKIAQFNILENDITTLENSKINDEELQKHFSGINVDEIDLKMIKSKINEVNIVVEKKKNPLLIVLLCFSIGLIITSIILMNFNLHNLFIIFIVFGVLLLILDMFIYFNSSLKKTNIINEKTKQELNTIFSSYRYFGDDFNALYYQLENDVNKYKELLLNKENNEKNIKLKKEEKELLKISIEEFFKRFNILNDNYLLNIKLINDEVNKLNFLEKTYNEYVIKEKEYQQKIKEINDKINDFYDKYKLNKSLTIDEINNDLIQYNILWKNLKNIENKYNNFKESNHLSDDYHEKNIDFETIKNQKEKINEEYHNALMEINELEEEISSLDDKKNQLENNNQEKEIIEEKIKINDYVNKELIKADQNLKDKFVSPIKNKFCEYSLLIEKTIGEKVSMDKDYRIFFDREGMLRSSDHLSSGNLAICALCFRLALIDNMFTNENPFIIMDDPFVLLDETHFQKTKELIKLLAKNKQIIYFTCHQSRKI